MESNPGYEALRRFRASKPHTDYFLTMGTAGRKAGLIHPTVAPVLRPEINAMETAGYWTVRGAVIMPDHLHLLVTLHERLPLGRVIARFKSKTRPALLSLGLHWQGNYYEHRLRSTEAIEPVLRYIFLNPYRANLLPSSETYPWFWLGTAEADWFQPKLEEGNPFAEWLR